MQLSQYKLSTLVALSVFASACGASNSASLSAADGSSTEALSGSSAAARAIRLKSQSTMCLDVKDVTDAVGADMQVWTCHYGTNQTFTLDSNGLIHVFDDMCLAAPASGTGQVVLAACSPSDKTQQWQVQSDALVAAASKSCLSISSKSATDGTMVSVAACASGDAEQSWIVGTKVADGSSSTSTDSSSTADSPSTSSASSSSSTTLASGAAKTLTTVPAASMDTLSGKVPSRLKAQMANIATAAAKYNLQPQMLVAIAMEESTGGSDGSAYSNGGGMFQFTDTGTWKEFGTSNTSDRQNDALEVTAAAKYMAYLLNESGSFSAALRAYNGAISAGGNPSYISDIESKMLGNF